MDTIVNFFQKLFEMIQAILDAVFGTVDAAKQEKRESLFDLFKNLGE